MRKEVKHILGKLSKIAEDNSVVASTRVKAYELIGKAYGLWEDKIPDPRAGLTSEELEAELKADLLKWFGEAEAKKETSEAEVFYKTKKVGQKH